MEELSTEYQEHFFVRSISFIHSQAPANYKDRSLPYVSFSYREHETQLSVHEARNLARNIFLAIAYAEVDAALFANQFPTRIGFRINPKESQQELEKKSKELKRVRSQRRDLPGGVKPVLGHKTQLPFVEFPIGSSVQRVDVETAAMLAGWLLEAAESGEYDILFQRFMTQKIEVESDTVAFVLADFQLYRRQNILEKTLNVTN